MINLTTYFKSYETKTAQKTSLIIYCSNDISKKIIEDVIILRFLLIRVDCAPSNLRLGTDGIEPAIKKI